MISESQEFDLQQKAIANAEYEEEKRKARQQKKGHRITVEIIARRNGLGEKQLRYYRANHLTASRIARRKNK